MHWNKLLTIILHDCPYCYWCIDSSVCIITCMAGNNHNRNTARWNILLVDPLFLSDPRLVALCLLENDGVLQMAREFGGSCQSDDISTEQLNSTISRVAQLVTSVPDKAQSGTSNSLSSQYPPIILCWIVLILAYMLMCMWYTQHSWKTELLLDKCFHTLEPLERFTVY